MTPTSPAAPGPASVREPASALRGSILASSGRVSLAFVDVTGVGVVNQRLGRAAGDLLLATFEDRLRAAAAADDRVWRLGGDEYALLMPGRSARTSARRLRSLHRRMGREAVTVAPGYRVTPAFRAGGATVRDGASAADDVFDAAAGALRRAKRSDSRIVWSRAR